jgi:serine/threonine protein kinase
MRFLFLLLFLISTCLSAKPIEQIVQDDLKIPSAQIKKNNTNDLVEGGKLAEVFFIQDKTSKTPIIIKKFSKTHQGYEYQKEVEAYQFLQKTAFKTLFIPTVLHCIEDDEAFYIVLSKAKGTSLNQILKNRKIVPFWSRPQYDEEILLAMRKCAKAFDELHFKTGHIVTKKIHVDSNAPLELAKRVSKSIHYPKIVKEFSAIRNKISNKPIQFSVSHGDLHLGNIFYDEKTKTLTLIDFSTLSGYEEKMGKMPIAEEVANFIAHFESIAYLHGINEKETNRFIEEFKKHYPHYEEMKEEIAYYRMLTHLRLIEICEDETNDAQLNHQMKAIAHYSKKAISSPLVS